MHNHAVSLFCVCAIVSIVGCQDAKDSPQMSNISYAESSDGSIFYTTSSGELFCRSTDGSSSLLLSSSNSFYSSVDVSSDSERLVVVEQSFDRRIVPSVVVLEMESNYGVSVSRRFSGFSPRFAAKEAVVFFARPTRFIPQHGIGGNFWTDSFVWKIDLKSGYEKQISETSFAFLDGIAEYADRQKLFVSAIETQQTDRMIENIVVCDLHTGRSRKLHECQSGYVCGGDPSISPGLNRFLFVSDRKVDFNYWIYSQELGTDQIDLVDKSREYRVSRNPEFSKVDSDSILALSTNAFTTDGQAKIELLKFRNDDVVTVLPYSVLTQEREPR